MKRFKVCMDKESWQKGFQAGQKREELDLPPKGVEVLNWHTGYIEGISKATEKDYQKMDKESWEKSQK